MSIEGSDESRDWLDEEEKGCVNCWQLKWWHGGGFERGALAANLSSSISISDRIQSNNQGDCES